MIFNILDLIQKNPFWEEANLILSDDKLKELSLQPFPYKHPLLENFPINKEGVMTLRGPRQIGKTTLTKQIMKKLLLEEKINPENIFYYSCNMISDFKELHNLLNLYLEEYGYKNNDFLYIFLDEISFVADWPRTIKELAEGPLGKRILFFLTGSSTVDLEFSSERLPGRRGKLPQYDVTFLPMTFAEFIHLIKPESKNWQEKETLYLPKLRALFKEYLLTGGFPAVINEYYKNKLVSSDTFKIYLAWIAGDMHKLGKSDILTEKILSRVFRSLTTPLSYYEIAKDSSLSSYMTAFEYLDYLERLFVLFKMDCFLISQKKADLRKNRKFYPFDPFILFALWSKVSNMTDNSFSFALQKTKEVDFFPKLIETVVALHLKRIFPTLFYGKIAQKEIDFVGFDKEKYHFFEVKYQENINLSDFVFFNKAMPKNKLTVISKKNYFRNKYLSVIPLEMFLLNVA